jgi:hypothetical protein
LAGLRDGPLEEGEVLVCETTDPSWVSHMVLAAWLAAAERSASPARPYHQDSRDSLRPTRK